MSQHVEEKLLVSSPVAQFYEDKTVLVTGATGFMGKVLVEKLLRSTNVKKMILLIRPKRGVLPEKRLQDLFSSRIFEGLKKTRPGQLNRVSAIQGDITEPNLGISEEDTRVLINSVNIVFHSAATVKFDEDLTEAMSMNVDSVLSMVKLCKQMKFLEALVHVSTAYCNCDRKRITEEIYPPPANPEGIIQICKYLDDEVLNSPEITAKLIGNRPNTYTFTKALAENILVTEGKDLPISIVRPSIVSSAWREPIPGWVDNLNGPTGMVGGALKGVLRTIRCGRELIADLVPVDIPINLMCCVAWRTAMDRNNKKIQVYNCTSGTLNPFRWGQFEAWGYEAMMKFPSTQILWFPGGSLKSSDYAHRFCQVVFHSIPAYIIDGIAKLANQKPFLVKISQRMHKAAKALEYFTINEWVWTNDNTVALYKQISDTDRNVFNFDISQIHWPSYIEDYVKGVREFVFLEDESTIPASIKNLNRMYILDKAVQFLLFIIFWRVIFCRSEIGERLWNFVFDLIFRFFRLLPIGSDL